jgi:hypothetical protein
MRQTTIRYLKLPFQFDEQKLVRDLSCISDEQWIPHFNTSGYTGAWKAIPLYAPNGDASNIFALPSRESTLLETPLLKACDYFKEVISTFQCPISGVGADIKPHRDHELGYEDGSFRIHIPIITNAGVRFVLDGILLTMLPGECWYTNVNHVHSVSNAGATDRFHLVIDGERNEWSDQIFLSLASEENFQPKHTGNDSPEVMKRTIEELKRRNDSSAEALIKELENTISSHV